MVGKAGVESGAVIEGFDVVEDGRASLSTGSKAVMIDQLVFKAAPKGFNEGVVVAVSWTAHGSNQAVLGQELAVGATGELGATIRVEDEV